MKTLGLLLAIVGLAGCASSSGSRSTAQFHPADAALTAQNTSLATYEYQLDVEPVDLGTPFLHLVETPAE